MSSTIPVHTPLLNQDRKKLAPSDPGGDSSRGWGCQRRAKVLRFCDALASDATRDFPEPQDALPSIPNVVKAISDVHSTYPGMFFHHRRRDLTSIEQETAFEHDHMVLRQIFLSALDGETYFQQLQIFLWSLTHKTELIKTIQALDTLNALVMRNGCDSARCLREERKTYLRQFYSDEPDVHVTASFKMTQILFLQVLFVYGRQIPTGLQVPPPPSLLRSGTVDPNLTIFTKAMRLLEDDDPEVSDDDLDVCLGSAVMPVHHGWFAHDVPLFLTPWFELICTWAGVECLESEPFFVEKMAAHRSFLSYTAGSLKARLALVNAAQTKMLGGVATILWWLIWWSSRLAGFVTDSNLTNTNST